MTIEFLIEQKLLEEFSPIYLDITKKGFDVDPSGKDQLHVNVVIISNVFEEKKIHVRHKAINHILEHELRENVSILTLHTYTEKEWLYRHATLPYFLINKGAEKNIA